MSVVITPGGDCQRADSTSKLCLVAASTKNFSSSIIVLEAMFLEDDK